MIKDIHFRPMNKEEFAFYLNQLLNRIAKDAVRACNVPEDQALRIAKKDLTDALRDGIETKDSFPFIIIGNENAIVGYLWLSVRGEGEQETPYLTDLFITPHFRGQGLGKKALTLLETELRSRGIAQNIAVHVLGDFNEAALKLFKGSGYFVTSILMEKTIVSQTLGSNRDQKPS